jgi:hypothetical protein
MRAAGRLQGMLKRRVMWGRIWDPRRQQLDPLAVLGGQCQREEGIAVDLGADGPVVTRGLEVTHPRRHPAEILEHQSGVDLHGRILPCRIRAREAPRCATP